MATVSDLKDQIDEVLGLMRRLVRERRMRDPLADLHTNLTGPQIHVLANLGVAGVPMPMHELAHQINASSPAMTGIIDRLERQGLVQRVRDDDDRRVVLISLTEDGRAAVAVFESDARTKITRLMSALTHDERCSFVHLIGRIVDVMSSASSSEPSPTEKNTP
jgi:DNA-binding MarR family transcriptional regulator